MNRTVDGKTTKPRILIDCDPGVDDAVALMIAATYADIVGVTTVGGNVGLESTTANALALCDILGIGDVEVHSGHDLPLNGSLKHRAAEFHGPNGTGDVELPCSSRSATSTDAVQWIIETVRAEEGLWLVPTGPLTNVADAFRKAPDIIDRLRGISWMGGSSTVGNVTAAAEFNCWVDPAAADIVFRSGHPNLVMSGLNVTTQVILERSKIVELAQSTAGTPASVFIDLLTYYELKQRAVVDRSGAVIHDVMAVLAVTHPQLFSSVRRSVEVVVDEGPAIGMTLVDQRPRTTPAEANVSVLEKAEAEAIANLIVETFHLRARL